MMSNPALDKCFGVESLTEDELKRLKNRGTNNMSNEIVKQEQKQMTAGERFTNKVIAEFSGGVGELALTDFQKRLVQNYFIYIDAALASAEEKRKKKKKPDALPVTWENVDMSSLSRVVVAAARIGLDPAQDNHISLIPFKNNALNKYGVTPIEGYKGKELKAMKYGLDVPDSVIVELVYSTDIFKPLKKSLSNKYESYEFEIANPFNRGKIIGGFYYYVYTNNPEKNKLTMMSEADILKRKPEYAAAEFWGGEKDVWENGQVVGKKKVEGWTEKMYYKTVYRAAYGGITIDSQKIDTDYLELKRNEESFLEAKVDMEIDENANKQVIDISPAQDVEYQEDESQPVESAEEGPDF